MSEQREQKFDLLENNANAVRAVMAAVESTIGPKGLDTMLVDQFEKLHEEKKESLILISHQEKIIRMADRIMVIRDGRVDSIGPKDQVLPRLLSGEKNCSCMNPPCRA